ncbi:ATP-binding cassette domain-containing protein [Clostridium tyrobutyricum]|jgi:putative ABC transport system ATP-binding protein|uniref:ABC transporter, ATP-binding protein n=1 Tax=Clostridium tyrobutyricum DIVETGP TaxID=1408889 RepID=W6N9A6_CLOTY|nr:ABC transporter ATP-binding protein [Clostridium tyrobutyricum]AND83659.1 antimicrobial peptide ABC transporter ATPase [Clostridium tyrobutyricum]ANP68429.1 multidrug ABC transporter ATP-binding protein [Clostridium tyrobutyricum]MBV4433865.1 ABC transporter ATP-binding protein [Clostridium tyrobutyricum]MBV4450591.1 ABC transporter ATP-binding protein [Clostridium tyrobutyricum]QCH26468.1 putative ABC transporter ATP-binding protein [Clostridium tyrobutyricum]
MAFIEFKDVKKEYVTGDVSITAVENCSFSVEKGQLVVILGPSGAGKTTVLNLLGGMDIPSGGSITVNGNAIHTYTKKELVNYRRSDIGFVFQFYNLVGNLTALENVELACQICSDYIEPKTVLEQVGLSERMNNFPAQLSGGEQQRVAIARAIAKNPKLLLCDEPTGALDSVTGQRVIELLQNTCRKMDTTTILITHNAALADIADKVIKVKNGTVKDIVINKNPKKAKEIAW